MNKTLMTSLAVLVRVIGMGSHVLYHPAEAKGIPKRWLNHDGTVKAKYLKVLKSTSVTTVFPIPQAKAYCRS